MLQTIEQIFEETYKLSSSVIEHSPVFYVIYYISNHNLQNSVWLTPVAPFTNMV